MKKKLLTISAALAAFTLGLGLITVKNNNASIEVEAATHNQHLENFDPYSYSGSYYNGIDSNSLTYGINGSLRTSLTELIEPEAWYTYSGSGANTLSTQLQYADEDPTNSNNMIYFYSRDSVKKNAASSWNREHVWPKSLSGGNFVESKAGTDILHLRPTYNTVNSTRSSLLMGDTGKSSAYYYDGMLCGYKTSGMFEPLDCIKGDVAREYMYLWVAYRSIYNSKPLNILNVIENYDTLLKWHTDDKPDVLEGNRNDYSETSKQKNRNPFVDHPEYAWMVFGDLASASAKQECMETYPADGTPAKTLASISISGQATKKSYMAGDTFDPTGLTVTGHYDDSSTKEIAVSNCVWTPNPLVEGITSVTCTYSGKSATYSGITVSAAHEHTFSNEYSSDATYHWYAATCGHDVVKGKERHSFKDEVTPATEQSGGYTTHTCKTCGYTYVDGQTQPLTLVRILVVDNKSDTGYKIGEELDLTVTAVYNDNSQVVITDYTVEGFNKNKAGDQSVIVFYGGRGTVVPITVLPGEGGDEEGPDKPDQPDKSEKEKRGCNGSITASLSITAFSALIGLVFIFSKKRK
ncbi:MAG: endonuclease [Bacilli bacterium]|nr:endonuclease [Bacilli bacterium]